MEVKIEYWGGWGYKRFAESLANLLDDEYPGKLSFNLWKDPVTSGRFEVFVDNVLVHSKLNGDGGKCETDVEKDKIIEAIRQKLE